MRFAVVAELAYAHDSGSCPGFWVRVQVPSTALYKSLDSLESRLFLLCFNKYIYLLKQPLGDIPSKSMAVV